MRRPVAVLVFLASALGMASARLAPPAVVEYPIPRAGSFPHDPATGKVREWRSPSDNAGPYGIAIGTDGRIWYCESRTGTMVAFDPGTEKMETVPISTAGAIVRHMETDSARGRIWLALSGTGRLGKIELGRR